MPKPTVRVLPNEVCTNYKLLPNEKLLSVSIPFSRAPNDVGLVGILTVPPTAQIPESELIKSPTTTESHYPPTHKFAVIVHGKGGHKNYCYQALLAQELATKLGIYSFRFDFRGCGDSQDNEDEPFGRTIKQDVEDIDLVLDVFENGKSYEDIGINLVPNSIIGHSRGGVAMFRWALDQQQKLDSGEKYRIVPNLVNAAARYNASLLLMQFGQRNGEDVYLNQYRKGEYKELIIRKGEQLDLGSQDLSGLKDLDEEFEVLSIYGLADHIVPLEDSSHYANLLGSRHTLTFIPNADHNYYGITKVDTPEAAQRLNPDGLPLTKTLMVNWNYKVVHVIIGWLHTLQDTQRFRNSTKAIHYYPRWKSIDGISNFRDVGGWRTKDNKHYVRPGLIYRCANPSKVTQKGKEQLKSLGVKSFFDFRSYGEFAKNNGLEIDGIQVNNIPVYKSTDLSPQALALRYSNLLSSWYTFKYVYRDMLESGGSAFKSVFQHILDFPNDALVFNCQAGKDRTGVMAMLILLLLGVDSHTIAKEYELTTIGLVPDFPEIRKEFLYMLEGFDKKLKHDEISAEKLIDGKSSKAKAISEHFKNAPVSKLTPEEMFQNLISSKYESMIATIEMFDKEFGGIEKYLTHNLGFSLDELARVRDILLIDVGSGTVDKKDAYGKEIWKHRSASTSLL